MLSDNQWLGLVREFLRDYCSATPYFPRVGKEFVGFMSNRKPQKEGPGYLLELAHYENIEFELFMVDALHMSARLDKQFDGSTSVRLSNLARPLVYHFPVHQISNARAINDDVPALTFLLVFQDETGNVRFFELQNLTFQLLLALQDNESETLKSCVMTLFQSACENDASFSMSEGQFMVAAFEMLQQFQSFGVLLDNRMIDEAVISE